MTTTIGKGKVTILVLIKETEFDQFVDIIKRMVVDFPLIEVVVAVKKDLDDFKTVIREGNDIIFVLDLTSDDNKIKGFGDRYLGIAEKTIRAITGDPIFELNEEYATWYSENTEFSTLQFNRERADFDGILRSILSYFNGK